MYSNMSADYKVYQRRWLYLFVACLVNFSNGNTWISYAAITFYTNDFYGNNNATLLFNIIFMALSIPVGFLACWWTDRFGLRSAYHIGAWSNFIGNIIRVAGSGTWLPKEWRFPITFIGQTVAAFAQPFVMFLPTKLAAYWFPQNQRGLANTLSSMSNPIGIAVMYSVSPVIVNDQHPKAFPLLTGCCAALATLTVLCSLLVTKSKPPTPVSASCDSDISIPSFSESIKICFRSKTYWILASCLGGGVGLFNVLYNNLQPALCVKGYFPTFNGLMGTLLIMSGLIGSAITGIYVDKTGKFEQTMKISFLCAGLAACSLAISINYENVAWWIIISIFFFGVFAFAIYPIGLEMGVECTFPVPEATSTGLIIMMGQIQGVIYLLLTNLTVGKPNPHELAIQTCADNNETLKSVVTWRVPFLIWTGILVCLVMIFVILFWPIYRRREYEESRAKPIKNNTPTVENIKFIEDLVQESTKL